MRLTGNTIMITGAGTGIGLETAKLFSERGNKVIMVARNEDRLKMEASKLTGAIPIACDISDDKDLGNLIQTLKTDHDDLNVVFLNAGVTNNYRLFTRVKAVDCARVEMATNYLPAIRLTQELEPVLGDKLDAAFIITTSGVALVPDVSNPTYSATKAALHSAIQAMRYTLQKSKSSIKVFEVMAPLVDSPFAKEVRSDKKVPPAEVAKAILEGFEHDQFEMHVGVVEELYAAFLKSPQDTLLLLNEMTGA